MTQNEPRFASAAFECDKTLLNAVQRAELNGLPYGVKLVYGKEVTGESFVDREGREQIVAAHSPLGVDMETAAAAQVCALNRVPFLALRTVTDTPFESGLEVFGKNKQALSLLPNCQSACRGRRRGKYRGFSLRKKRKKDFLRRQGRKRRNLKLLFRHF